MLTDSVSQHTMENGKSSDATLSLVTTCNDKVIIIITFKKLNHFLVCLLNHSNEQNSQNKTLFIIVPPWNPDLNIIVL